MGEWLTDWLTDCVGDWHLTGVAHESWLGEKSEQKFLICLVPGPEFLQWLKIEILF